MGVSGTQRAGTVLLLGAGVAAVVQLLQSGGWSAPLSGLTTSARPGTSRAQTMQDLQTRAAELRGQIEQETRRIEATYARRDARTSFEGLKDEIKEVCEDACGFLDVVCLWNPYRECDDQVLAEARADLEAWREAQYSERVEPLRAELETIEAEIDSVILTA